MALLRQMKMKQAVARLPDMCQHVGGNPIACRREEGDGGKNERRKPETARCPFAECPEEAFDDQQIAAKERNERADGRKSGWNMRRERGQYLFRG